MKFTKKSKRPEVQSFCLLATLKLSRHLNNQYTDLNMEIGEFLIKGRIYERSLQLREKPLSRMLLSKAYGCVLKQHLM